MEKIIQLVALPAPEGKTLPVVYGLGKSGTVYVREIVSNGQYKWEKLLDNPE